MRHRFFTSDTHFGHRNIIRYSNRPFKDVPHMNEMIIQNWNSVVGEDDIIFHLGDVALGSWEDWDGILTRLNGYKILVVGNHDRIFKGERERMQTRFAEHYAGWFDEIYDNIGGLELENGTRVNLSHFPYDGDSHDGDRYTEFRMEDKGVPLIHGHTHLDKIMSRSKKGTAQIHVGQDAFDYTPVSENQVIDFLRVIDDAGEVGR